MGRTPNLGHPSSYLTSVLFLVHPYRIQTRLLLVTVVAPRFNKAFPSPPAISVTLLTHTLARGEINKLPTQKFPTYPETAHYVHAIKQTHLL